MALQNPHFGLSSSHLDFRDLQTSQAYRDTIRNYPSNMLLIAVLTSVAMKLRAFFKAAADSPSSRFESTPAAWPCCEWLGDSLCSELVEFSRARLVMTFQPLGQRSWFVSGIDGVAMIWPRFAAGAAAPARKDP